MRAIVSAIVAICFSSLSSEQDWTKARLIDLYFVNETGHTLDIKTNYRQPRNEPVLVLDKSKNSKEKALKLVNQSFGTIESYTLSYRYGQRYWTGGVITIDTSRLAQEIEGQGQREAFITIVPSKTWLGYVTGFQGYRVSVRPAGSSKEPVKSVLEDSFIAVSPDNERLTILKEMGFKENMQPYEIFGLGVPPKADQSKSFNEQRPEVYTYLKDLDTRYENLIKKWSETLDIDKRMYDRHRIKDFTIKARELIAVARDYVLTEVGAK